MQAKNAYLYAKAQGLRAGEDAGRQQGEQEAAQQLEQFRTQAQALLCEERAKRAQTLSEADAECREQAESFAQALAQKIFGQAADMAPTAENAPLLLPVPVSAVEAECSGQQEDMPELPTLDMQEIQQAARIVFSDEQPDEEMDLNFADLPTIPARILQKVLKSVKIRDLAVAIKGMDAAGCAALLDNLPKRLRETARQELDFLGPVPLEDTEQAQKRILKMARRLLQSGQADR